MVLSLLGVLSILSLASAAPPEVITGEPGVADNRVLVNIKGLASAEVKYGWTNRALLNAKIARPIMPRKPQTGGEQPQGLMAPAASEVYSAPAPTKTKSLRGAPKSPRPSVGFLALDDNDTVIPPDTQGAVGPNHVVTTLNSQVRVQDRTGVILSTVDLPVFWAPTGAFSPFDPRIEYDAFNDRWIFTSMADGFLPTSALLVAVSQTGDPTGNWFLYRILSDPLGVSWSDYDMLGFNKDWIVVSGNMFSTFTGGLTSENIWVFNKTNLYGGGPGFFTLLRDFSLRGFSMVPMVSFDNTNSAMYLVDVDNLYLNFFGFSSQLRISTITGALGAERLIPGTGFVTNNSAWVSTELGFGGSAPQLGSTTLIENDDSRMQNVVYRNGSLWCTHTIFVPQTNGFGLITNAPGAVQWWQLTPTGTVLQSGRIADPAGNIYYAYPSIAVNRNSDVLIGYSRFSASQYASANYSYRSAFDPPNTLQSDIVLKAGEAPYFKTFGSGENRWGDYSSTVVDPVNDIDMWTLQEYAASPLFGADRWGTWWGKVDVVNTSPFRFEFSSDSYFVGEANPGFASITVLNIGGTPGSVDYFTTDGTAIAGSDYLPAQGTLIFAAGQFSTNFSVPILDNGVVNSNKVLSLGLANPQGGPVLGFLTNASLTIIDDESQLPVSTAGEFNFSVYVDGILPYYMVTENETEFDVECFPGSPPDIERSALGGLITVVRTNGSTGKVLVDYATADGGTAFPFLDYLPVSGTLVFDDYQMSTNFVVPVFSNFLPDGNKFVRLVLSNARPAPEEEAARPGLIRPTLGLGSESLLSIADVDFGYLTQTTLTNFTAMPAFTWERLNYRFDEYPNRDPRLPGAAGTKVATLTVIKAPTAGGRVQVSFPNLVSGFPLMAGSDYALAPNGVAGPFQVWPNPVFSDPSLTTITNFQDYTPLSIVLDFQNTCRLNVQLVVHNDTDVEFNEDAIGILFRIGGQPIVNPDGQICNVTILYDDQPAGALDREWNVDGVESSEPAFNPAPGANNVVEALAVQPDGKTILGGDFTAVNSKPRNRIARMNFNGSLDTTFDPGNGADGFVSSLLIYATNSPFANDILVGGGFTSINGFQRNGIARLLPNGALDNSFTPGNGANAPIRGMALQPDDKVLVAGDFSEYNDIARNGFARLNTDGSLDLSFDIGTGADGTVRAIGFVSDGQGGFKVLVGGDFTFINGEFRPGIAQLNPNGTVDLNFNPGAGVNGTVYAVAVQADGSIIIAGDFSQVDGKQRGNIARLNSDGSVDTTFLPGTGANGSVYSLLLQPDGKAVLGGIFTSYNNTRRVGLARLRLNGSLDTSFMDTAYNQFAGLINGFSFEPPNFANAIALQPDGNIMVGGSFHQIGGNPSFLKDIPNQYTVFTRADKRPRSNIARIIGNTTPGPGNAEYDTDEYFTSEDAGTAYIKLQRSDGRLGTLIAEAGTIDRTATSGVDFLSTNLVAVWPQGYYPTNINLTFPIGFPTNFAPQSVGRVDPIYLPIPILDDTLQEGDEVADLTFVRPDGNIILGGEYIPLGGALGRSSAKLTISDNDFSRGEFNFSSVSYFTNEDAVQAIITVIRTNGSVGQVSVDYFTRNSSIPPIATANVDYAPVRGTLTFASGQTSRTFVVPIIDDTVVEFDENIELVLTNATSNARLPGGLPTSIAVAQLTILDNDFAPGHINFSSSLYNTNAESDGFATITVTRSGGNVGFISAQFQTSDGTAISGLDYLSTNGLLTWNDGNSTPKTFRVPLITDGLVEGPETVNLRLVDARLGGVPNSDLFGLRTNATLVILDSDSFGGVSFSQPFYQADENGGGAVITVVRTSGIGGTGSVNFATSPGTALPGLDYVDTSGVLTFLPGEFSKSFNVGILNNSVQDGNRALTLTLFNPTNVALGVPNQVTLTIVDDESFNEPAGSLDPAFNSGAQANGPVYALALQKNSGATDGRLLVAGDFTQLNHVLRARIGRLMTNGTLDSSFDPGVGVTNGSIRTIAMQADGRVLVGGAFSQVGGTNRNSIARLTTDGKLDAFFNPGSGADNPVYALAVQPDDRILVGGSFSKFNSFTRPGIVRLNTNGSVDLTFTTGSGANGTVYAVAIQGDGKVLIGGDFTQVNGKPFNRLARLNPNGTMDLTFTNLGAGLDAAVRAIVVQPDGKVVIGGSFTLVNGVARNYLARLNQDGSLDGSFMASVSGGDNTVYAIAQQPDGKFIVAGDFGQFNNVTRLRITRLNSDGTTDPTINFGSGADGFINAVVLQPDRKIVIGGGFANYDDHQRLHIARIHGGTIAGPGTLTFSRGEFQVSENTTNAVITVKRQGGTTGAIQVNYSTSDGTAEGGTDYIPTQGTLTFPSGETVRSFNVPILDDNITNDDRFLNLALSGYSGGATSGPQPSAILLILNDESAIGFTSDTFNFNKNAVSGNATITLRRTYATNSTISALFATVDGGTATPGVDYLPTNLVVTFFPGEVAKSVNVRLLNNTNITGNKTVFMILTNAVATPNAATFVDIPASTLTIVDDNFAPGVFVFSSPLYTVNEYETNVTITVIRTNGSAGIVSVQYATLNGTAQAGQDYVSTNGTLAFADGETARTFSVAIVPDYIDETNETVLLVLSNPTGGATLGITRAAEVLIIDNKLVNGNLNFTATNYVAHESNLVATITVSRTLGFLGAIAVGYRTVDGTATNGDEYIGVTNVLNWANGDSSPKSFTVTLLANNTVEGPTTVGLELFSPQGGASLGGRASATLTILDDDKGPGKLGFISTSYFVSEASSNALIRVQRVLGMSGTVTVDFAVSPGTALPGINYRATNGTLVFLDGETNKSFAIPIIRNSSVENNKTVNLQLSNPRGGASTNGQIIASVLTIIEDQPQAGSVDSGFTGSGANDQIYSVVVMTNQQQVANNNKILAGGDFTLFNGLSRTRLARLNTDGSLDVSFDAGTNVNSSVRTIVSQTDGSLLVGGSFTNIAASAFSYLALLQSGGTLATNFLSGLSGVDNFVYAAAIQTGGKVVLGGRFSSVDGVGRSFIARLNPDGSVDATFSSIPGPDAAVRALIAQPDGKILIAGEFATINGTPASRLARLNGNGSLDLAFVQNIGGGADNTVSALAQQSDGRILLGGLFTHWNGISVGRIVRLNSDGTLDATFNPGSGANEFVSALALQGDEKVLVGGGFTSFNGVARNRLARLNKDGTVDYSINFGSGANNFVSTIAVQPDRKIVVGGAFTQFNDQPHNFIVRLNGGDNFGPGEFVFSAANYTTAENVTNVTITVLRQIGTSNTVSVDFNTADGTATNSVHYLGTNGTLVFAEGETIKTFTLTILDDTAPNINRTLTLSLSNPQNLSDSLHPPTLGIPSVATLTILDNDAVVGFSIDTYTVSESETNAVIAVQRLGGSVGTVTVRYATLDGSAIGGVDYTPASGMLVFTNGQTLQSFNIPILNDTLVEGNETVGLSLTNITGTAVLGLAGATLTIVDDDFSSGALGFTRTNFNVSEQGFNATVTVARSPGSSGSASLQFSTSDGTATAGLDYVSTNGLLVFAEGEFTKSFQVRIFDDFLVEGPETINLTLSNPIGAVLGQATATLTILADEAIFDFSSTTYSVLESGTNAIITVLRNGGGTGPVSIGFATSNLTATAGLDYVGTNGTLNFIPGQTNATFVVPIINDILGEGNETILLTLSNPTGEAVLGLTNQAILTIVDDDTSFEFSQPNYLVNENGGNAVITVNRIGSSNGVVSVGFQTSDGTATANQDYVFKSLVLSFASGETNKTVLVPIIDDTIGEGNETVNLSLLNPTNGTSLGLQSTAILTIIDNEDTLSFDAATYFVDESGSNIIVSVVRMGVPGTTNLVTVRYSTINGTATAGLDYVGVTNTLTFNVFETLKSFSIPIIDDSLPEGDETVVLRLSNPTGGATLVNPTNAILTIMDNDVAIRFSSASYLVSESGTNAVITVNRLGAVNTPVSVNFATSNGTATANTDYVPASGTLFFGVGVTNQVFTVPILDDLLIEGNETVSLRLFGAAPTNVAGLISPSNAVLTIVDNDSSTIVPAGSAFIREGITNGILDANELVTINFGLRNVGNVDTTSLIATLLPTNGVAAPSGPGNYGAVIAGGATVSRPFTFTVAGTNGGTVNATFHLQDGANDLGIVTFGYTIGRARFTFTNQASIVINDFAPANIYPSVIVVSNVPGAVTNLTVSLRGLNHDYPNDVDVMLQGPQTTNVILMAHVGNFSDNPLVNVNLTFDDNAGSSLAPAVPIISGTYKPSRAGIFNFPAPAPPPPYTAPLTVGTLSGLYNGVNPNGTWSLYVQDDSSQNSGFISGGWSMTIETTSSGTPAADLSLSMFATPDPIALINHNLRYTLSVTNSGPATATSVFLTNTLPATATFISCSGSFTRSGNVIVCNLGNLASGAGTNTVITVQPTVAGIITDTAVVATTQLDLNLNNNAGALRTSVSSQPSLIIAPKEPGSFDLVISFPTALTNYNFQVEATTSLSPPHWVPVSSVQTPSGGQISITVSPTNGTQFFRLREP